MYQQDLCSYPSLMHEDCWCKQNMNIYNHSATLFAIYLLTQITRQTKNFFSAMYKFKFKFN